MNSSRFDFAIVSNYYQLWNMLPNNLHEDWERNLQTKAKGYVSGELLRNLQNFREFFAIMRFKSQEFAQSSANDPEHKAWSIRLTSLAEGMPTLSECTSEWHSQADN